MVGMASLFKLGGLVGRHRNTSVEPPVQHRPPPGVLSVIGFFTNYDCLGPMATPSAGTALPVPCISERE